MRLSVASLRRVVKRDLPIEFVPQQLTSYGGLELLRRYLQRIDLSGRLGRALGKLGSDYGSARLGLLVLALFYVGGRRPEHLQYLAGDPLVHRFCGLARVPTARTVGNWLRTFTRTTLTALSRLNHELVTDAVAQLRLPRLTIDVDGTVVRTGATVGWAFRGFNPHHRKDPSYLCLLFTPSASSRLNFRSACWMMAAMLTLILTGLLRGVRTHRALVLENVALRHQLAVLQRTAPRPRLRPSDRLFWVLLSRLWRGWAEVVAIVQPETVLRWHRAGFTRYWTWKSRRRGPGRPAVASDVRALICRMSEANPLWGAPRIHGELQKLGLEISQATVSKYVMRLRKPPSQTWRTFLTNHVETLVSVDFFTVSTVTFKVLFVFVVLAHHRRRVVHFNVTDAPTAQWTGQQLVEAFPWEPAPGYLLRDRDAVYGVVFSSRAQALGIHEVKTAPRSPWQNPYVERLIGTLRRECLDHVVVLNEAHLHRLLRAYLAYYHGARTHLSLAKDAPDPRPVDRLDEGRIVETPMVGGLHHRYTRQAA